jgi:hypothetical protein
VPDMPAVQRIRIAAVVVAPDRNGKVQRAALNSLAIVRA